MDKLRVMIIGFGKMFIFIKIEYHKSLLNDV